MSYRNALTLAAGLLCGLGFGAWGLAVEFDWSWELAGCLAAMAFAAGMKCGAMLQAWADEAPGSDPDPGRPLPPPTIEPERPWILEPDLEGAPAPPAPTVRGPGSSRRARSPGPTILPYPGPDAWRGPAG